MRVGALLPAATACEGPQSTLDPKGPVAAMLAETWWLMLAGGTAVFALVLALALYAVLRRTERPLPINPHLFIALGGVAFPVVTLTALLLYSVVVSGRVQLEGEDALQIDVIGHQWWWEVRYPAYGAAITANEIHIPAGKPVRLRVWSADVIHSFWVPTLAGKIDLLPGQRNALSLQADDPGVYPGQCAEFCGAQHARMRLLLIAQPPAAFASWVEQQARAARAPESAAAVRGREAYLRLACPECHTIRGLEAPPREHVGPDLTHVASRRRIAGATLDNTANNLKAWIRNSQTLKPGNQMPSFEDLDPAVVDDVVAYLQALQ